MNFRFFALFPLLAACGPDAGDLTHTQDELRIKRHCALPFDDSYEQNDFAAQATDLSQFGWSSFGPFSRVRVTNAIAIQSDRDYYELTLTKWSTVRASFTTTGPLYASLYSVHPELGWQDGFYKVITGSGFSSASSGRLLPPGTYYLMVVREAVCKATRYSFTMIVGEDNDNDGVPFAADNCPVNTNHDQRDHDRDGVGDACDPLAIPCTGATEGGQCRGTMSFSGRQRMHYWRNYPLNRTNRQVSRAVIVVHGNTNNAWDYYNSIVVPAANNGTLNNTLIISPYFRDNAENNVTHPSGHVVWSSSGWKHGNLSDSNFATPRLSSFAVMDTLINDKIIGSGRFPNLTEIVVTGHSAGGQYTQRYALGGRAQTGLISIRYGVLNPSSYTWLNSFRRSNGAWVTPTTPANYDDYPMGLATGLNSYMTTSAASAALPDRFVSRDVWFLAGELEQNCECGANANRCLPVLPTNDCTCCQSGCLDCSADAIAQGTDRFDRMSNIVQSLSDYFNHDAEMRVIPNVGHNSSQMYRCGAGPVFLFGSWAQPDQNCP